MTVNPGYSGQELMPECLPKFQEARRLCGPRLLLEVDGGITAANIQAVRDAGANVIVAATAIFKSSDYKKAIRMLRGKDVRSRRACAGAAGRRTQLK
jgi:ribulose-phosphate 3-epimerase